MSRHVRLRPISPADYEYLYRLLVSPGVGARWRFRGATPMPQDFPAYLGQGVLVQFVAERRERPQPLGLVTAYNADFQNRHVFIAAVTDPRVQRAGWPLEAVLLLLDHVFACFDFRKAYFEVPAFNLGSFSSAVGRTLEEEGRLREHEYFDGRWWDRVYLSIDRWERVRTRYGSLLSS